MSSSSTSSTNNGVHILVFPFPAQGHMLALLDLTYLLSLRGLTITILITPKNLPILSPLLSAGPSIQTLILPFPVDQSLPPAVENVRDIGNHGNIPIIAALSKLRQPIIQWFNSHRNPPVAILSDFFLGWTQFLAEDLGIPRICFYGVGAFVVSIFDRIWAKFGEIEPGSELGLSELPRSPSFGWDELPSLFRRCKASEFGNKEGSDFIRASMAANGLSWASVFNSFWALEDEFLDYFSRTVGRARVYGVGPLNITNGSDKLRVGHENCGSGVDIISWLDQWADGSVLYICFGSQKLLKKAQMEALAIGLERSGVHFVWVVKNLSAQQLEDGYGSVPDGFEVRVSGRGLVLKEWAPQTAILGHRAVGGFLSHCGWNSVMEAVAAGVMILGWPMEADQFGNAKFLVEYKAAAVMMCRGEDAVPDSAELARRIGESMRGDGVERAAAKELRRKALEAVGVGGRSSSDLDGLVREIAQLKV